MFQCSIVRSSSYPMTDPITRLNSALEGRYRIGRGIGEGGIPYRSLPKPRV